MCVFVKLFCTSLSRNMFMLQVICLASSRRQKFLFEMLPGYHTQVTDKREYHTLNIKIKASVYSFQLLRTLSLSFIAWLRVQTDKWNQATPSPGCTSTGVKNQVRLEWRKNCWPGLRSHLNSVCSSCWSYPSLMSENYRALLGWCKHSCYQLLKDNVRAFKKCESDVR